MGIVTSNPGMERNYVDCGRVHECRHAWLIERSTMRTVDTLHTVDYWDGLGWTRRKDDAIRFTRWIDASRVIDHVLPCPPPSWQQFIPTFHDNLAFPFNTFVLVPPETA